MEEDRDSPEKHQDQSSVVEDNGLRNLLDLNKEHLYLSIRDELVSLGIKRDATLDRLAFYWLRVLLFDRNPRPSTRPVAIVLGPTGSGKTYGIKRLCERLSIPHFTVDCSGLVGSGIVGACIPDVITQAFIELEAPSGPFAKTAMLVFDEVHALSGEHLYSMAVKRELLAVLAGEPVTATEDRNIRQVATDRKIVLPGQIPTMNFTPILIGSFDGTLTRRKGEPCGFGPERPGKGFGAELSSAKTAEVYRVLEREGMVPGELLGRINIPPVVIDPPTCEDLRYVLHLRDDRNPLQTLVREDLGMDFHLSEETATRLVDQAMERGLGYRSLRQVCEEYIADHLSEMLRSDGLNEDVVQL